MYKRGVAMHMSEMDLLEKLNKEFPTKSIFAEQYSRISHTLKFEIHKQAKGEGLSSVQWLIQKGFIWKEIGYVEPDMIYRESSVSAEGLNHDAFTLADYVLRVYPLVGEYHLSNLEDELLYRSASATVKKVLLSRGEITLQEEVVLVVETINLLKEWSTELEGEESFGTFWNYIFLQYGFNSESSNAAREMFFLPHLKQTFFFQKGKRIFDIKSP